MRLTTQEKKVIDEFKHRIMNVFPGEILKLVIFGSKVRGDATNNSDIDVMVITASGDWRKGDLIREIGYELDGKIDYKLSIQVVAKSHIDYLKNNNFQFIQNIEKEGITV